MAEPAAKRTRRSRDADLKEAGIAFFRNPLRVTIKRFARVAYAVRVEAIERLAREHPDISIVKVYTESYLSLALVHCLPRIKNLKLHGPCGADEALCVSRKGSLQDLTADASLIPHLGLHTFPSVEHLRLHEWDSTYAMNIAAAFPNIVSFSTCSDVTGHALSTLIAACTRLKTLDVSTARNPLLEVKRLSASSRSRIESLDIDSDLRWDLIKDVPACFPCLHTLWLACGGVVNVDELLRSMPRLRKLTLSFAEGGGVPPVTADHPNLTHLTIRSYLFEGGGDSQEWIDAKRLPNLVSLDVTRGVDYEAVIGHPSLKTLRVNDHQLHAAELVSILNYTPSLSTVEVGGLVRGACGSDADDLVDALLRPGAATLVITNSLEYMYASHVLATATLARCGFPVRHVPELIASFL
jgi:hypothetical protein